jgi:hypothetical protein
MKSAITPLLPRLHFGLPFRGRRPPQPMVTRTVREVLQHTLHRPSAIDRHSAAASFTLRVTTPWPQATATNGNPNRQGGIAVHGQSSTRALCVIPTLNKPLCPRQLRLMKSAITPLLPRLHFGLPLRGRRPPQPMVTRTVREVLQYTANHLHACSA